MKESLEQFNRVIRLLPECNCDAGEGYADCDRSCRQGNRMTASMQQSR